MQMLKIISQYQAFDGTIIVVYQDATGYQNTVPMFIFKKVLKQFNKQFKTN